MNEFSFRLVFLRTSSLFLVLVLVLSVVAPFAYATSADDAEGYIELDDPVRIFNEDGTVTVVYDIPTSSKAFVYGRPSDSDTYELIFEDDCIYLEQTVSHQLTVFHALHNFTAKFATYTSYYDAYGAVKSFGSLPFQPELVTHLIVDGVEYVTTVSKDALDYIFEDDSPIVFMRLRHNSDIYLQALFAEQGMHSIVFGFYHDVSVPAEYEYMFANIFPFVGEGRTSRKKIDISDIKPGFSFDLNVSYDYDIDLIGEATSGDIFQTIFFFDRYGNKVHEERTAVSGFSISDGVSVTLTSTVTVPAGAAYMDVVLGTGDIEISKVEKLNWRISSFQLSVDMSAVQSNSQMIEAINKKLDEISKGTPGANVGADNMQDVAGDYKDHVNNQLQNGQTQMDKLDQLPRPDVSGAVTLPEWATSEQFLGFNAVVATVWENETIYEIMVVASILMLASYILFGKKV